MTNQQKESLKTVVTINPKIMGGTPCFAGTRVPIQALIDHLEGGATVDKFLTGFPADSREQAIQFIEPAKDQLLESASSLTSAIHHYRQEYRISTEPSPVSIRHRRGPGPSQRYRVLDPTLL